MALILNKELDSGIVLDKSYHKISSLTCTANIIDFVVEIYKDKEARQNNKKAIECKSYRCSHDVTNESFNSIKQAYEYLKTLSEYKNSEDDLDD